ncbi:MAG: hypothetical protein ACKOOI_08900 [Pirellula sp.]
MPKLKKTATSAREQTIQLTPEEQLACWQALQAPTKLTLAQKRLGAIMRGQLSGNPPWVIGRHPG